MNTTFAFETEIGIVASTARRRTAKYARDGAEPVDRFMTKSTVTKRAMPGSRKGGA